MSDLQAALLVLGAVIIVTVLIYNKWQENRYRKAAERGFARKHEDALVAPQPEKDQNAGNALAATMPAPAARIEPQYSDLAPKATGTARNDAHQDKPAQPPESPTPIDYCVVLTMKSEIDSSKVIEAAVKLLADFNKLVHLDIYDSQSASWRSIEHREACQTIRGCVQLVDRRGCIDPVQLGRFDHAMRSLAVQLGANASKEGLAEAQARAKELDEFCAEVDIKVGLNVISPDLPFTGDKILAAALAAGLELGADGGFHRRDASARSLFRMSNLDNVAFSKATLAMLKTRAITIEIDVPRTSPDSGLVSNLFDTAATFAEAIGGRLVDDNHLSIGDAALASIRAQIEQTYRRMQEHGFPAGDPLALRLFS